MATKKRFAALIRVSTEKQEKQGESLHTQRKLNEQIVKKLGGKIVEWYGGQEHGTAGYEKREIERLLSDAQRGRFDAVIVANADRWSRDNDHSQKGLAILKDKRIEFYTGATRWDLYTPSHKLFLGMSAEIGAFFASNQKLSSIQNRIERAKRGIPTGGKKPFGRSFVDGKWVIDKKKHAMIKDVAARYLDDVPLPKLAAEYGVNPANLHKTLMHRCGSDWSIEFKVEELNIHEVVPFTIPALLDAKMIAAVRRKAAANKTYSHGQGKNAYLLSRMVFCSHCGYAMFGQTNHNQKRYYRHTHTYRVKECSCPKKAWVEADQLEEAVIHHLFECFGNPKAVEDAIRAATPNPEKVNELLQRRTRISNEINKSKEGQANVTKLVLKGLIKNSEAELELQKELKRIEQANEELCLIDAQLENMPTGDKLKKIASGVGRRFASARLTAKRDIANSKLEKMTWDEKRALVEMVFGGKLADGKRMGVYIEWIAGEEKRRKKRWKYTIHGHLIEEEGQIPMTQAALDSFTFGAAWWQKELVTKSAWH